MYKWTLYDHGRALQSGFWRNEAAVLRLAVAADLPHDLYPHSVPWRALMRVVDAPRDGAEGVLHQLNLQREVLRMQWREVTRMSLREEFVQLAMQAGSAWIMYS